MTARDVTREVLERVELRGAYAAPALSAALDRARDMAPEDRALATELVYGVLRRRARLDRALAPLASRGLDAVDPRVRVALRVAAYQILFLQRIPAYAAVDDAVEACKAIGGRGVAGFANALLRRLGREGEPPLPDAAADPAGYLTQADGLPAWLASLLLADVPTSDALAFAASIAAPAPLTMRANTPRIGRDALIARLAGERAGAALAASPIAPDAIEARGLGEPATTAAWREGLFAIQDAGAQVVVALCGAAPGERILDACAGRGGKTAQLLALSDGRAQVDAADVSRAKLDEAAAALRRLGLERGAAFVVADLTQPLPDPTPRYHRILLDAPCSGLGVLRRHPEALLRRRPEDLATLAAQQLKMLRAVAPALLPGGLLVYAVCTFDRAECEDVVAAFLASAPEFAVEPAAAAGGGVPWERLTESGEERVVGSGRTWPQRDGADGFFAVRLRKRA
jgi:16S rRNA (cytosine967-C5)-methyltransferase